MEKHLRSVFARQAGPRTRESAGQNPILRLFFKDLGRAKGIEPSYAAWEAVISDKQNYDCVLKS